MAWRCRREHTTPPKRNCPATHPCAVPGNRHILVGIPPSPCASCPVWVPAMLPALGRILFRHHSPSRVWMPPSWWIRAIPSAPHPCAPRPCVCRCHRASCAATSDRLPARPRPVLSGQRLGTDAGNALLGGSAAGLFMIPVVIRCRFRSTVAVPIPFTRVKSSTRRKWPCCRRYATIASALRGPTFANPCCSVDASAVLMSIRSDACAAAISNSPSTSALHENQGPTLLLLVARHPVPAGYPVGSASVPRHIHTAYRPQRLHTASQIPDVV